MKRSCEEIGLYACAIQETSAGDSEWRPRRSGEPGVGTGERRGRGSGVGGHLEARGLLGWHNTLAS